MNNFGFDLLPNVITNLTSKLTVLYICQSGTSGYANAAKGYIYDLIQQNISVSVRTFSADNTDIVETSSFDSLINSKKKCNSYFNSVVIHSTPDMWGHLANIAGINGKNVIGRTVWEFDKLIPQWVDAINNSIVNTVSVPTNWNKTVFEQSGVKKPIIVEPHIYVKFPYVKTDLENLISQKGMVIYKGDFSKIDVKSAYKLYTIGQFIHRKGIAETIEAYCKSFYIKDNVILFVKTFGKDYSDEEQYKCLEKIKNIIGELNVPPIVFLNQMFTYDEIQSLHEQCDCYVQLTRSEGFGLGIFEAFNRGKNLIVTNYGGHTEYLPKSYEGLVQYEKVSVTDPIYSNFELDTTYEWAKPNLEHAKKIIKSHLGLIDKEIPSNQTVNVALNGFYHLESFIENRIGNISRWSEKTARVILLNKIKEVECEVHILNLNKNNSSVTINGETYSHKFDLTHGLNIVKFTHIGDYIAFVSEKVLCPKQELGVEDERNLGVVVFDLSIGKHQLNITNKIYYENLKLIDVTETINFIPTNILGKKVGIIGYISPPSVLNTNLQFLKNINSFKSYSNHILFSDGWWKNTISVENPLTVVDNNNQKIGLWTFFKCLIIAKKYELDYFLMIESDCRVMRNNWDYDLFEYAIKNNAYAYGSLNISNYEKNHLEFGYIDELNIKSKYPCISQGNMEGDGRPRIWTNGALTVYNTDIYYKLLGDDLTRIFKEWFSWDYNCCKMIIDTFGSIESTNRILHSDNIVSNVESVVGLNYVVKNHSSYLAIHPVKTNWIPSKHKNYSFYHGGDLGDIIYSMPSIKIIGGGDITFGNKDINDVILRTREPFTTNTYKFLKPLIEHQSYIKSVSYTDDVTMTYDYNFNEFRHYWNDTEYRTSKKINRLVDVNLDFVGVRSLYNETDPWLTCSKNRIAKYVVSRSPRYRDTSFPWQLIYNIIKDDCIFIGLDDEHVDFCQTIGPIRYVKVNDALEMAEIINGADLFIGNQSFPCSIAIGLNQNVFQEYSYTQKDCIFNRPNFYTKETFKIDI